MQLLSVILYSRWGDRREVLFTPGQLNVVTGQSKTGKSALLDIVEFCLGRSTVTMPVGPITTTVSWYAVLLQLPGGVHAFVARPVPRPGAATTQQGMLEVGANLNALEFEALKINADATSIRSQLGRLIGIEENVTSVPSGSLRQGFEANLGHAVLFCLQGQSEIASRNFLFHRQGEDGIAGAIQDTLPYFLGAVPPDQAAKRQLLDSSRRDLRRAEATLVSAEHAAEQLDVRLRAAVAEAYAAGLVSQAVYPDRGSSLDALQAAIATGPSAVAALDDELQGRLRELEQRRVQLRQRLREGSELRSMLVAQGREEGLYRDAVVTQVDRLRSVELLPEPGNDHDRNCPVCGSSLSVDDPTAADLRDALSEVRAQLAALEAARPRLQESLREIDGQLGGLREELRGLEAAASEMTRAVDPVLQTRAEERAFNRGRLEVLLQSLTQVDASGLHNARQRVAGLRSAVERLEAELNVDDEREQTTSRLLAIGADMTRWSDTLQLEHSGGPVRLDLRRLTVIAETESGPAVMARTGSAANWIGYHLVTHLGLHRFFARQRRPVPRFLMLDQPTQAYYPSEVSQGSGVADTDEDRLAVRRLYELINEVVKELGGEFQAIVCDHANLDEGWFQDAIVENWREGGQLVPREWIERASQEST